MSCTFSGLKQNRIRFIRGLLITLSAMLVISGPLMLAGCSEETEAPLVVANYGNYGSGLAEELAAAYPYRSPGSDQEEDAGDYLIKGFEDLGYQPVVTEFPFVDESGATHKSRNIAVVIKGRGFVRTGEDGKTENITSQVIIGAHYDTAISEEEATAATSVTSETTAADTTLEGEIKEPTLADYDGIHDNASGIGALMTIASQIKANQYGYDVILVAFGAGSASQAGANFYARQMTKSEIAKTDAMYCLDSIYAGDKVYAHSGRNSIKANNMKDYEKRRKLYEITDVFYEYELYTNNNFMLYTNQSAIDVQLPKFSKPVIYREWSLNDSDYVPFDNQGIPIVFFESYDYDKQSLESMKESQNPSFGSTGGMIRRTAYDAASYLDKILNSTRSTASTSSTKTKASIDQLTKRINNVAFIILEAINKGMNGAVVR